MTVVSAIFNIVVLRVNVRLSRVASGGPGDIPCMWRMRGAGVRMGGLTRYDEVFAVDYQKFNLVVAAFMDGDWRGR